jgi:hypothetical protein
MNNNIYGFPNFNISQLYGVPEEAKISKPIPKKVEVDNKKLSGFQKNQITQLGWWLNNIKENINDSILSLQYNCAPANRITQARVLDNQLKMIKLVAQVRAGKTLLQGFNYKHTFKKDNTSEN